MVRQQPGTAHVISTADKKNQRPDGNRSRHISFVNPLAGEGQFSLSRLPASRATPRVSIAAATGEIKKW